MFGQQVSTMLGYLANPDLTSAKSEVRRQELRIKHLHSIISASRQAATIKLAVFLGKDSAPEKIEDDEPLYKILATAVARNRIRLPSKVMKSDVLHELIMRLEAIQSITGK